MTKSTPLPSAPMSARWPAAPIGRVAAPLRDQVLDVVRKGILDFQLRPGQRLIERELMEQLGVSRATVREVVARLASEGLVTIVPQRGAIVAVLSREEAADLYEMRAALEALATTRFVQRATDAEVAEIRAAFTALEEVGPEAEFNADRLRTKDVFYQVLFKGAASPSLTQILTMLQDRVRLLRWTSLSLPDRPRRMLEEMRAILAAIEARDAEAAAAACAQYVRNAASAALEQMAEEQPVARAAR